MNVAPATEIPIKPPLPQITTTNILGPYKTVLRWSGLDLSQSCVKRSGNWAKSVCNVVVAFLICFTMLLKTLILMMETTKPMTLDWAINCVWSFMALHGFASAVFVVFWTRSRLLPTLQDTLVRVQNHRGPLYGSMDLTSTYRRIVVGALIFIITWILSAMKGILFEESVANTSQPFIVKYPITLKTMYGLDPIVYVALGISSSLALMFYVLMYAHVNREWTSFNEDLANAARLQQLGVPGVLSAFSMRQSELLRMVKLVSQKTEVFASLSTLCAGFTCANTIFLVTGFDGEASVVLKVLSVLWLNSSVAIILITHKQPAQTQSEIANTAQLLIADDFSQSSPDNVAWRTLRIMIDRSHYNSTKMYFMQAFAIDQHFAHKILLIAPNIGSLMVVIKRMGLV